MLKTAVLFFLLITLFSALSQAKGSYCSAIFANQDTLSKLAHPSDYRNFELYDWVTGSLERQSQTSTTKKIFSRINMLLSLMPPNPKDKIVPETLRIKVVADGVDSHAVELSQIYRSTGQYKTDTLRRARKFYGYLLMAVSAQLGAVHLNNQVEANAQAQKAAVVAEVETIDKGLDQIELMLDNGVFDDI